MDDLIRRLRSVAVHHAAAALYGGVAGEMHMRMQTSIDDAIAEIVRLREAMSPEVTCEAPCPICRRKTWRYAINDALGLDEPYAGDALERAVTCIHGLRDLAARVNEIPGLTAALDAARYERDVALGKTTEREQALREIERLVKENEGLRRGMSQI